jgi:hypothetical protein
MITPPLTLRNATPFLLAVLVAPLAACICGDRDHWGFGEGTSSSGTTGSDSNWPPPTRPNGGGAGGTTGAAGDAGGTGGLAGTSGWGATGHDATPGADGGVTPGSTVDGSNAAGAGVCGCDGGTTTHPPVCQFDNQCGTDGRCRDGACERGCTTASSCGTGQVCAQGTCQAPPGAGGQCVYDADCGGNATCINGVCHAGCTTNAACGAADRCVDAVCQPDLGPWPQCHASTDCAPGRACVNAVCRTPCAADADCCAGSSGPYCRDGVCVTAHEAAPQCHVSAECGLAQACLDGACS